MYRDSKSSGLPRRILPELGEEIAEGADPLRHRFAFRPHEADGTGLFLPSWQDMDEAASAQLVGHIPQFPQRYAEPGDAPCSQRVAAVGRKIARHRKILSLAALAQRPTVPPQPRIGKQQAGVVRKVAGLCRGSMLFEIVGRGDEDAPVVGKPTCDQPGIGKLRHADRHVDVAGIEVHDAVSQMQLEPDLRVLLAKGDRRRRHIAAAERHRGRHADRACQFTRSGARYLGGFVEQGESGACPLGHGPAFLGDLQSAGVALEQGCSELPFQPGDLFADCGGREVHRAGGGRKAAAFSHADKHRQIIEVTNHFFQNAVSVLSLCAFPTNHAKCRVRLKQLRLPVSDVPQGKGGLVWKGRPMPPVIYIFSLCAFAVGFTEFITIGLVSAIANDLQVDVTRIGLTVTTYAAGVVIGAPLLTALAARWSRKHLILAAMLVFSAGNVIAGLSDSLIPLLFARLLSGLAHGVFFAVASSVATRLVAPERAGAALALVFGGVTVAMSLGVPIGTWLGSILHWQVIFLVIAACGLIGSLGIATMMPAGSGEAATRGAGLRDLGVLFDRRLLAGASIPMLSYTGSFALYTFVSPILLQVTNVSVETASLTLLAYGLGAAAGNVLGGRLTDRQGMDRASVILLVGIVLSLVLITFALRQPFAMIGLVALLGMTTYGAIPPLQSRILMLAERHRSQAMDVASGMNIAAFNAGVVVGSGIGSAAITAWGLPSLAPVGAAVAMVAVIALLRQIALPSMKAPGRDAAPAVARGGH